MIIVHDIFICKPGNASKLASKFKEGLKGLSEFDHVMTDAVGQFNKVILVSHYESLTAYEQSFEKYMTQAEEMKQFQKAIEGYHDMYLTGTREIYKIA